jgi:DNA-binding GntR family transcriptional regulator
MGSLADETYDAIKAKVLDHQIAPGEHVGIDELARELGVSQTPVREALARLESDGLVVKTPLRGYEATDLLSVQRFDQLFQFRSVIEPWAASAAARRSIRSDLDALQGELDRAKRIQGSGPDAYAEFVEHDSRFHALVARASGNSWIEEAFVRTHCHLHLFRVYRATFSAEGEEGTFVRAMFAEYYEGGETPLALTQHGAIVAAIARGADDSAAELMLHHIESSRQRFFPAVEALNVTASSPLHRDVQPPSIGSVTPVIREAARDAKNVTAPATSSGTPIR